MRSPWQLIMWKRKQFNKGQTRFENRLGRVAAVEGGVAAVKWGEQSRGEGGGEMERDGGGDGGVCGCRRSVACFPPACEGSVSVPRTPE